MKTVEFQVEGMTCGHCVRTVTMAIINAGAEGTADLHSGKAKATFDESAIDFDRVRKAIEEEGYQVNA